MYAQPMRRAADAYATADKWQGWILDAAGHGEQWARVFRAGPQDSERIWAAVRCRRAPCAGLGRPRPSAARRGLRRRRDAHDQRPHRVGRDGLALPRRGRRPTVVEITTTELDPAARIIFVSLAKLRRVT